MKAFRIACVVWLTFCSSALLPNAPCIFNLLNILGCQRRLASRVAHSCLLVALSLVSAATLHPSLLPARGIYYTVDAEQITDLEDHVARTIAIGDIHGCADALQAVLEAIAPHKDDTIVTLGDYVDRGPDSRRVIDILLELKTRSHLVPLIGNHEAMMLTARSQPDQLDFWQFCGGRETLASYGGALDEVPDAHWLFFEECLLWYETDTHFFVHANYDPEVDLNEQPQELLLWTHLTQGVPGPHRNGKIAVVGHTPQPERLVADWGHVMCIDTCCFGDGCLTACELPSRKVWQADRAGQLLE